MDEGKYDRFAGAVSGYIAAYPGSLTPILDAIEAIEGAAVEGAVSALLPLHPLDRVAFCILAGGEDQDWLRYLAAETCAATHPDSSDVEACVLFASEIHDLIRGIEPPPNTHYPPEGNPPTGVEKEALEARLKALKFHSVSEFFDPGQLQDRLSGATALIIGARFGLGSILSHIAPGPDPTLMAEIGKREFRGPRI